MTAPTQATAREAVEQIQAALTKLPADANARWVKLDNLPYIHATNDPAAKPYSSPVVGRFDYLDTADYMLACCPPNIRAVLALLAAEQEEVDKMRADAERYQLLRDGPGEWDMFRDSWLSKMNIYGGGPDDLDAAIDSLREPKRGGKS